MNQAVQSCGSRVEARVHGVSEGQDCRDRAGARAQRASDRRAVGRRGGKNLIEWLGVAAAQFMNLDLFSLPPMDFYHPGTALNGDLPPHQEFLGLTCCDELGQWALLNRALLKARTVPGLFTSSRFAC